jgi:phage tail-like protein
MARRTNDPVASSNFLIESGNVIQAGFNECTGLNVEHDVIEYREGNEDITVRKLPGLKKFGVVTLKRGVGTGNQIFDWLKSVMDGDIQRISLSIIQQDEQRNEVIRYNLVNAWPSKWTGPEWKAGASEISFESLEIAHEGVSTS